MEGRSYVFPSFSFHLLIYVMKRLGNHILIGLEDLIKLIDNPNFIDLETGTGYFDLNQGETVTIESTLKQLVKLWYKKYSELTKWALITLGPEVQLGPGEDCFPTPIQFVNFLVDREESIFIGNVELYRYVKKIEELLKSKGLPEVYINKVRGFLRTMDSVPPKQLVSDFNYYNYLDTVISEIIDNGILSKAEMLSVFTEK